MVLAALLTSGKIRCDIMKFPLVTLTAFLLIQVSFSPARGQSSYEDENGTLREVVIDPNCKTIQLYREGWPLSYPVINLYEDVPLVLKLIVIGLKVIDKAFKFFLRTNQWLNLTKRHHDC